MINPDRIKEKDLNQLVIDVRTLVDFTKQQAERIYKLEMSKAFKDRKHDEIEKRIYDMGLRKLLEDSAYSWNLEVACCRADDGTIEYTDFEKWSKSFNRIPSWISEDDLMDVTLGARHEMYRELCQKAYEKFIDREKSNDDETD